MNFTQLKAFQAVANNGSITKAAQLLHVSQPLVSKHLKNLEKDFGVKLFERNRGAAELTDAGSSLLRHANAILVHLDEARKELRASKTSNKSDPLKIAGSYAASALLLPSLLVNFKNKHRDTSIILRTGTTREVKSMLLNSTVELALLNELPVNPEFVSEPFRKEKLVVFAAPNHPLAKKKRLTLSDLRQAALVTTCMASAVDKMLNHLVQGLGAKIAIQCGSPASVKIVVKNKIGLGILFQDMLIQEIRNKLFKVLEIPGLALTVQSYIVYYKDRPLSTSAKDFLALLRKRVPLNL
ncbi:MAG TPA: LysR family transcriptional regulator [Candidatus Binatia bacterium]|nr:LysR family transcriptional regulator [Candidatus Binatia bacterium]